MAASSNDNVDSPLPVENPSGDDEKSSSNNLHDQHRKLFIGGLSYTTTDETLKDYCARYGEVTECIIMRDRENRSRGFAFVSFKDRAMLDDFMAQRPHVIDGRQTEPKRAMPRDEASKPEGQLTVKKIFIGGVKEDITEADLKSHFENFGNIIECKIMKDKEDKFRGFAFITFDDYDAVDRCILEKPHLINNKELDVRKAIPRDQTSRTNHFLLTNHNNLNPDLYSPHLMVNHSTLPPPSYPPYAYFPSPNYLTKPMPLMASSHAGVLPPTAFLLPPELAANAFFRNQTYPSPPPSTASLARPTTNPSPYQNGSRPKSNHEQSIASNDSTQQPSSTELPNSPTSIRPKSRTTRPSSSTNDPNSEQHRKLFIGGLSLKTTDETLKEYVTKFGEVSDSLVMKDQNGQSRCFGFVTFTDPETIDKFMQQRPHTLDGREIDPKRAMPREEANNDEVHLTVKKIFIGGIREGLDEDTLRNYFEKFGHVNDCFLMRDKDGKTRGFAFLEFDDFDSVDKVILARPHVINDLRIDVKKAVPKDQRQMQAVHHHHQQQQQHHFQQQQYALQMQAAAAAAYQFYYNHSPFNLINNGNYSFPIASSSSHTLNALNGTGLDEVYAPNRTAHINVTNNNNHNLPNSLRYIPTRNNRRQSSRGSQ